MTIQIKVPEMGESVTEGTVARWFKAIGDAVAADEALVEIETDKVTVEVPAPSAGVLSEISAGEGTDVEVGAIIGAIDETASAAPTNGSGDSAKSEAAAEAPAAQEPAAKEPAPQEPAAQEAKSETPQNGDKPAAAAAPSAAASGETTDVKVPEMGESVTEGTVGRWLKSVGDSVAADEALVEIETDKVTAEIPAPVAGVLAEVLAHEGDDVEVGAIVARIAAGDSAEAMAQTQAASSAPEPGAPKPKTAPAAEDKPAEQKSAAQTANTDYPLAPAVRKLVDENGLDPAQIPASGKDGRLTKGDVLSWLESGGKAKPAPAAASSAAPAPAAAPAAGFRPAAELPEREPDARGEERVRMTKLRQTIATRLKEAQNTAAMLTTFNEVDMSAVMALRSEFRDSFEKKHGVKLGFMSFFVKACIKALQELPAVNAEIYGDEIVYKNYYDIGIAVGGAQGLVVPVMRDADKRSFADIEASINELGSRAREGKLTMKELTGGTFTITNGGIFGSMLSTPILNPPQSGILGMHNIVKRAVVETDAKGNDEVVVKPMMYLALSYDHRIVDGREAVTFLVRVKQAIEDPTRLMLDV